MQGHTRRRKGQKSRSVKCRGVKRRRSDRRARGGSSGCSAHLIARLAPLVSPSAATGEMATRSGMATGGVGGGGTTSGGFVRGAAEGTPMCTPFAGAGWSGAERPRFSASSSAAPLRSGATALTADAARPLSAQKPASDAFARSEAALVMAPAKPGRARQARPFSAAALATRRCLTTTQDARPRATRPCDAADLRTWLHSARRRCATPRGTQLQRGKDADKRVPRVPAQKCRRVMLPGVTRAGSQQQLHGRGRARVWQVQRASITQRRFYRPGRPTGVSSAGSEETRCSTSRRKEPKATASSTTRRCCV